MHLADLDLTIIDSVTDTHHIYYKCLQQIQIDNQKSFPQRLLEDRKFSIEHKIFQIIYLSKSKSLIQMILFLLQTSFSQDKIIQFKTLPHPVHRVYLALIQFDDLKYKAIVDTGSHLMSVKSRQASGQPLLKVKTKQNKNCDPSKTKKVEYTSGGIQGVLCKLKVKSLKTTFSILTLVFTNFTGKAIQNVQAIMGLFNRQQNNFLDALSAQKVITNKKISVFIELPEGKVVIGNAQTNIDSKLSFHSAKLSGTFFQLAFKSMFFNKKQKGVNGKMIIDTGTQFSIVPNQIIRFIALQLGFVFTKQCKLNKVDGYFINQCQGLTKQKKSLFPSFAIKFQKIFNFNPKLFQNCKAGKTGTENCSYNIKTSATELNKALMGINLMLNMLITADFKGKDINIGYIKK